MRMTTTVWLVLIAIAGGALFHVSYQVGRLASEKRALDRAIAAETQAIRVLDAEWSYLTQPPRLRALADQLSPLTPLVGLQLAGSAASIPRPLPTRPAVAHATRLVALTDVPGLSVVPLPGPHPSTLVHRRPELISAPAGDGASPPVPTAPVWRTGGDAPRALIEASVHFSTGGADGATGATAAGTWPW